VQQDLFANTQRFFQMRVGGQNEVAEAGFC
jgi:hypothetical protein